MDEAHRLLDRPEFPRSRTYDPDWVMDNQMGPNALWLLEWLTERVELRPGMRVLDLGCGRAMTSIYLAREYGVRVWALDLWIGPDQNWRRVVDAGVADLVSPMRGEAHSFPFPKGFFDAVVSIDAFTYFGTDALYLGYLSHFIRPGGTLGVVVPGLQQSFDTPPAHLSQEQANGKAFWSDDCWCFRTSEWWRTHWRRSGKLEGVEVDVLPDGWRHWRDFERALELAGKNIFPSDAEALEADRGEYIGFIRAVARRTSAEGENLYDPCVGVRHGVDG
jgi:SAM-dependent methyltransferase